MSPASFVFGPLGRQLPAAGVAVVLAADCSWSCLDWRLLPVVLGVVVGWLSGPFLSSFLCLSAFLSVCRGRLCTLRGARKGP